jgi:hypothetical protein
MAMESINLEEGKYIKHPHRLHPRAQSCNQGGGCLGDSRPLRITLVLRPSARQREALRVESKHFSHETPLNQTKSNQIRLLVQTRDTANESADQALARASATYLALSGLP